MEKTSTESPRSIRRFPTSREMLSAQPKEGRKKGREREKKNIQGDKMAINLFGMRREPKHSSVPQTERKRDERRRKKISGIQYDVIAYVIIIHVITPRHPSRLSAETRETSKSKVRTISPKKKKTFFDDELMCFYFTPILQQRNKIPSRSFRPTFLDHFYIKKDHRAIQNK
jgi:hypothetical protein